MPIYSVQGPDGRIYDIEGPEGASDAEVVSALEEHLASQPKPKKGMLAALSKGAESTLSGLRTGVEGAFGSPEEAARAGIQRGEDISGRYADQVSMDRVKEAYNKDGVLSAAKEVGRQIPLAIAEQAPNLATAFAGARLGAMAGTAIPVPFVGTAGGAIAGGLAGAFLPSLIQQYGGNIERQAQEQMARGEPIKIDTGAAGTAAAPQAALDVAQAFIPFGGKLVSKLTGIPEMAFFGRSAAQATKLADEKLLASLAKGTGVGLLAEVPTEIAQQMLQRAQAGLSLTSPDAMKEYGETAYQVGLLGPLGAVGRLSAKGAARDEVAARQAAEQEAAAQAAPAPVPAPEAAPEAPVTPEVAPAPEVTPAPEGVAPAVAPEVAPEPVAVPEVAPAPAAPTAIRETVRPGAVMGTMDTGVTPVAPPAPPVPDLNRTMEEYDRLKIQLSDLQTKLQEAASTGDTAKINELYAQYEPLAKQVEASAQTVEGLGGTTLTAAELATQSKAALGSIDTKIKNAQKKLTDAAQLGSFGELPKLTAKLDELKQERTDLMESFGQKRSVLEEKGINQEQRGQTRELFTAEEAPIPVAETKEEAMAVEQPPTAAPTEVVKEQKVATPESTVAAEKTYAEIQDLERQVARLRGKEIPDNADKIAKLNQLKADYAAATKPTLLDKNTIDLFSEQNIINTAIQSGDQATLEKVANTQIEKERQTKRSVAEEDRATKERLIQALDKRLNLSGTEVRRTVTPEQYDATMEEIKTLHNRVVKAQGNASNSYLQQLYDLANQEKTLVKSINDAQGVGKSFTRLNNQLNNLRKRYDNIFNTHVDPTRKEIEALYQGMYEVKPAAKASAVAAEKKAAGEAQLATLKVKDAEGKTVGAKVSRAAKTAKRITSGDVRKEAEDSAQMRKLAMSLGMQEPEYEKLGDNMAKRVAALREKYGKNDPEVTAFQLQMNDTLQAKALELGRKTPEYKATLAEQTDIVREALSQSKQETPSKRTVQETRKVRRAPTEDRTGSAESRVATEKKSLREAGSRLTKAQVEELVKAAYDSDTGTAYRTRETEGGTIDAKQAADFMEKVQSKLPSNVKLVYAANPGKIPVALLTRMSEEGVNPTEAMVQGAVFRDGTVLVVGDQHADLKDLEATVFHELVGHYGIDTIIGIPRLQAYANKTDLRKLAEEIGGQKLVDEVIRTAQFNAAQGKNEEVQRLQVLREIIAHTEEARVTESFRQKAGRWLKEFVGMIRAGLRDLGFTSSSVLSTSDVFYALKQSRKAFENKTIGPYRAADGEIAFRTKKEPTQYGASFIAKEPTLKDQLLGNIMGLTGRVQFVDKDAALSEAFKRGVAANAITSLEAQNAEFYLRFGQQRSQYAGQALTNGKLILRKGEGGGYVYDSVKGANMVEVAEALHKGKFANDSEAEAILTAYVAGERAKVKGWQKLNYENPALAEKEYNDVMRLLNSDKTKKDAVLEAARIYKEFNAGQIDFLVQTGAITPKLANELKSVPYIPYYRVNSNSGNIELMVDKETPVRIGNVKTEPQLKELVGGNKNILPIFTSSVQNTFMLTDLALRNQMIKESAFLLRKMGIASALGEGSGPASDSTVRFKVNGKDHFVFIDKIQYGIPAELIIKGMEGIKTTMPAAIKMMGIPADILRKFVTRNPSYAIRQVIRDPLNAWLTTGTDATPVLSSFKELATMVAGRSDVENKLMRSGAISTNVFTGDQRDAAKFLKDISAGKSGWDKLIAKADAFAMQGDAATRAVIYKDSLAKGMSEQAALLRTLESMNFSRRGLSPSMQALSIIIPFFNAQIQGLDVLYRAYTGQMPFSEQLKIKQKMIARGLMLSAGTLAYAALMSDDEAYKRAKPEERYGSWFMYLPGFDEPVRVPIPFELGYLFKALPEALWDMASNDEKASKAVGGWLKLVAQTNPFALPQAIKPLTEVYLGTSFFAGAIESQRESKMLAGERSRESTTEFAKLLGSFTGSETIKQITGKEGLSPIGIDYLIRGYTGGLGIGIVQLANPILNMEMKEDVAKPTLKASKTPFIGGLFQPVEGRGTLDEAYDRMLDIQQTKGSFNRLVEQGKTAEARAFAQEHAEALGAASVSGSVQQKLGEFSKYRRQVTEAPRLTTEQKDELLARIDKAQTEYARAFLKAVDKTTRQ
jgi:hypothetical protein